MIFRPLAPNAGPTGGDGSGFWNCYIDGVVDGGSEATGHNAYVAQAMNLYYHKTGDTRFLGVTKEIVDYLLNRQDTTDEVRNDGGLFVVLGNEDRKQKSVENNLAAYSAIANYVFLTGTSEYDDALAHLRAFLFTSELDPTDMWEGSRFFAGTTAQGTSINFGTVYTDVQSLSVLVLGSQFSVALSFIEGFTRDTFEYAPGMFVTGFMLNQNFADTSLNAMTSEATAQIALAYQAIDETVNSDFYLSEMEKLQQASGGFWQASNFGDAAGDDVNTREAIAGTAWYVMAAQGFNPLRILE